MSIEQANNFALAMMLSGSVIISLIMLIDFFDKKCRELQAIREKEEETARRKRVEKEIVSYYTYNTYTK